MVVRERRDLLIPGVAVLRRIPLYQGATENSEGEHKNSFGAREAKTSDWVSEAKRRNARARAEITDKTSEYFIRQRTKVTLEKRIHEEFRLSQIGYVNGTNGGIVKIDAIDRGRRAFFAFFLIDSYDELSSFTLANLSVATIKKKNTEERTT